MHKALSIIIPVYNVAEKLPRCLDSILAQSFSDFELCLVNDGSRDASLEVCEEYARRDSRIKVYDIVNGGAAEARNYGLEHTSAPLVMFIDSDDWLEPNMVATLYGYLQNNPKLDFACCGHYVEFQQNGRFKTSLPSAPALASETRTCTIQEGIGFLEESRRFPLLWDKIYRRDLIDKHHIRFEKQFVTGQDCDFNIKYFRHAKYCLVTNQALYHYRKDGTGSLCARYKDNLYDMLTELNHRKSLLYGELDMNSITRYREGYLQWAITNLQVCIPNMFRLNSPLSFEDKRRQFKRLFTDEFLRANISNYRPKERLSTLFKGLYRLQCPTLAVFVYSLLFFIRNHSERVYQFLRNSK